MKVGGNHHGGHGYKDFVIDGYPVKMGLRTAGRPDSSQVPAFRVRKPVK